VLDALRVSTRGAKVLEGAIRSVVFPVLFRSSEYPHTPEQSHAPLAGKYYRERDHHRALRDNPSEAQIHSYKRQQQ